MENPNNQPVIEVKNLSRAYGGTQALDDVSITVPRGCVYGLVGESGAGKTTLIRHILGLMHAKEGSVRVLGSDPVKDPVATLGKIGHLSEDRDLPKWMTVAELMRYSQGFYPNWDQAFAEDLRRQFELKPNQKIRTLSRGQTAKAGLVVALAHRPPLLVLDEPSSGLDAVVRRHILGAVMRTVAEEGRTVFFSSHLLDEVERVADVVAIMHRGKVMLCDRPGNIRKRYAAFQLTFDSPQDTPPRLSQAINCEGAGRVWTVLGKAPGDNLHAEAKALGVHVEPRSATLEDVFVALVGADMAGAWHA